MEQSGAKRNRMDRKHRFVGEFDHTLDPKGRIIIPSKYRQALGNKVYLVKSWDQECIYLFSTREWERIMTDFLANISPFDEEGQEFRRSLASDVEDVDMDRQGRLFIPLKLRVHAGIENAVTIIGVLDRLEIWNSKVWKREKEKTPFKQLAKRVENQFLKNAHSGTPG